MKNTLLLILVSFTFYANAQLQSPVQLSNAANFIQGFQVVDFESDGDNDVIGDNGYVGTFGHNPANEFAIYINDGVGNFTEHILNIEMDYSQTFWGDFNGDGITDLAFTPAYGVMNVTNYIQVLFGDQDYNFSDPVNVVTLPPPNEATSYSPYIKFLSGGDLNNDGDDEMIMVSNANFTDPNDTASGDIPFMYVIDWNGTEFGTPQFKFEMDMGFSEFGTSVFHIDVDDINGDDLNDMITSVGPDFGFDVIVYYGSGGGNFENLTYIFFPGTDSYGYGQMDNDLELEFVYNYANAHSRVGIAEENYMEMLESPYFTYEIGVLDASGDGLGDIVGAVTDVQYDLGNGNIAILVNNGNANSVWDTEIYTELAGVHIGLMSAQQMDGAFDKDLLIVGDGNLYLVKSSSQNSIPPNANFFADQTTICDGGSAVFTDASSSTTTSWLWTFEGGSPSTSNLQSPPAVTYSTPGSYVVSLTSSNAFGSDIETKSAYITVLPLQTFYADADFDGYGNPSSSVQNCVNPPGFVINNLDCNDGAFSIHPGLSEVCNTIDDNCNGQIDEGVTTTFYFDSDGDGFGNSASPIQACTIPAGYVLNANDCNDLNANIKPGATEICNNQDDDCDNQIDEGLGIVYYADIDGDGYGNISSSILVCTPPASGYVLNNGDCNDSNSSIRPGAVEVCNGINDDCDGLTDEGCSAMLLNDHPAGALTIPVNPTTVTTITSGNLIMATPSIEATTSAITGQDLWYRFTAPSPGIRIRVQSAIVNLLIELQTIDGVFVESENIKATPGNEFLNFGNLVEGQQYRVAVRNYNSAQGSGLFTISANFLNDSQLSSVLPSYQYCNSVTALPVGTNTYRFDFTSTTTGLNYFIVQSGSNAAKLSNVPGLPAGDSYIVKVRPVYNITNGLGISEAITVESNTLSTINVSSIPTVQLRSLDACPTIRSISSTIALNTSICGAIDYQWEFTPVLPTAGSPISILRGSSLTTFPLSMLPAVAGVTYDVRIRPKFGNGSFGNWGSSICLKIASAGMDLQDSNELKDDGEKALIEDPISSFVVSPNPAIGGSEIKLYCENMKEGWTKIQVMNVTGQVIVSKYEWMTNQTSTSLILDHAIPSGSYLIEINFDETRLIQRLIIL